jgi:hypothetical protein
MERDDPGGGDRPDACQAIKVAVNRLHEDIPPPLKNGAPDHERQHEEEQEYSKCNEKQDFGDSGRRRGDSREAEEGGNYRDHEENQCPCEHSHLQYQLRPPLSRETPSSSDEAPTYSFIIFSATEWASI